jgi:hypothetical protein
MHDWPYEITADYKRWSGERPELVAAARTADVADAAFAAACQAYSEAELTCCWGAIRRRYRPSPQQQRLYPAPLRARNILRGNWR